VQLVITQLLPMQELLEQDSTHLPLLAQVGAGGSGNLHSWVTQPLWVQLRWEQVSEDWQPGKEEQTVQLVWTQLRPAQVEFTQDSVQALVLAQVGFQTQSWVLQPFLVQLRTEHDFDSWQSGKAEQDVVFVCTQFPPSQLDVTVAGVHL